MKKYLFCWLIACFSQSNAEIIETAHFHEIYSHLTPETLVIIDIDDTLLVPVQMLGCDEWYMYRLNKRQQEGMTRPEAVEKSLAEWQAVRYLTEMEIVEPGNEAIVNDLQRRGHCVMALTTQGLALATHTVLQLKEKGIDFSKNCPSQGDQFCAIKRHGVLYRQGVLFTSGTGKGEALFALCDTIGLSPQRLVFINDKATHLADIELVAAQRGVPFLGLRYAYSDKRKADFQVAIAEWQFSHSTFNHILNDDEAHAMMQFSQ